MRCGLKKTNILVNEGLDRDGFLLASDAMPSPVLFFHGQEDLRKGIDKEGRVLEPLGCANY
jgi:hypothetical protein